MAKKTIGSKTFLYPMPTVIVGAKVKGKPNFLVIAYCGIVNHSPAMIAIASNKAHYTNEGIKEAGERHGFAVQCLGEDVVFGVRPSLIVQIEKEARGGKRPAAAKLTHTFVLDGGRARVALVRITTKPRLVPL